MQGSDSGFSCPEIASVMLILVLYALIFWIARWRSKL
jgi:hypothetical protein